MTATRIAIAAGGTAGHIYPALALAEELRRREPAREILFLGTPAGLETRLVPGAGYRLAVVPGTPFQRTDAAGKIRAVATAAAGFRSARRLLAGFRADAMIGFGGYASVGAVLAARSLGIWTAVHESNVAAGLANRALAPAVRRVYLTFDATARAFAPERVRIVGTPVRPAIAALAGVRRAAPPSRGGAIRVLVLAGAESSDFLNANAPELLARLARRGVRLCVQHQSGTEGAADVSRAYAAAGIPAEIAPYIADMAAAYARADLVVARAGGSTIAELSAAGLPALLVPLDGAAQDHQRRNAELFESSGAGILAAESRWEPEGLAEAALALLTQGPRWESAARAARSLARPEAAAAIAEDCVSA